MSGRIVLHLDKGLGWTKLNRPGFIGGLVT
jgi:hypothetical protein